MVARGRRAYDPAMAVRTPSEGPVRPTLRYEVGTHQLRITQLVPGRWLLALDDQQLSGSFDTRAEAWEAGVREADRRDQPPRAASSP